MTYWHHIYAKEYDMAKAIMCAYTQSDNALPQLKYVLQCCAKYTCVNILDQEIDDKYSNTTPSIQFQIYYIILHCTVHGSIPLNDKHIVACINIILLQNNPKNTH